MDPSDTIRAPRGTFDLTGETLARVEAVESAAREVFFRFGYREIRTPYFEETRLFGRAIGETSDVVEKEMFSIPRDGESYSLRPEGTASVVRHYVENSLASAAPFQKFSYVGAMFRYERPQAGRQRQFHQVGAEVLGSANPLLDAEMILLQDRFFRALGLSGQQVKVNSIGSREERPAVRARLLDLLRPAAGRLCENCVRRMERNVFRVLDCKNPGCREVSRALPPVEDLLSADSRRRYEAVLEALAGEGITFVKDPLLVRGLDYYTHTVFETVHPALGARDAICGGGRYDGLVEDLGGPATPAAGFAVGVESTLLAMQKLGATPNVPERAPDFFVVAVDDSVRGAAFRLLMELRDAGLAGEADFEGRSLKAQMKKAGRLNARHALILGPGEVERGVVTVRILAAGEQTEVPRAEVVGRLRGAR